MITESYSEEREALFSPGAFLGERKYLCNTAIATFSGEIHQAVIDKYPHREVGNICSANGRKPIYAIEINGKEIVFYLSSIGACLAGTEIIEMEWQTGVKNLIIFGSCGALDSEATNGKYIIPTQAYRDEGMSYHYAPPADYMEIKNSERLAEIFEEMRLSFIKGRIWTTDAPFRETKTAVEKRKSDGCIAVEMELAGVQAVCDFHGLELYSFLMTGDVLDGEEYALEGLSEANHCLDNFNIAVKIAEIIEREKTK